MSFTHVLHLSLALQTLCTGGTQVLHVAQPKRAASHAVAAKPSRLAAQVRASVVDELPAGWRLGRLQLFDAERQERSLRGSEIEVRSELPQNLVPGFNLVDVHVAVEGEVTHRLAAHVELLPTVMPKATPVITRGQEVMVVVRHGNVLVQAKGTAQQAAGLGERIAVLPNSGTHTLQAVVKDATTVEVPL